MYIKGEKDFKIIKNCYCNYDNDNLFTIIYFEKKINIIHPIMPIYSFTLTLYYNLFLKHCTVKLLHYINYFPVNKCQFINFLNCRICRNNGCFFLK